MLEFLVCPERKTTLIYDADGQELISPTADLAYPIRDGVPLLTTSLARPLTDRDRRKHRIKV
ncbi:MAG: Trm112 family protein [Pseudomonadota bacterium]